MAFAEVNGARLAWQQMGAGPDLILVHGLAASRAFWFSAATQLQGRYRVTLFDLRGHGYSSRPERGYRPQDFAGDILALMDHLGIARAALVGHSYGGAAALEAAGLAPARITHLGLLDTRVTRIQPLLRLHDARLITEVEKQIAATHPVDWASLPQVGYLFLETAARMRLAGKTPTARDDFSPFGEGRGAARAAKAWLDLLDHTSARSELDQPGMEPSQFARLSATPVLLMYAEFSRCLKSYEALRVLLPQAEAMIVPQAGHFFPLSQGERVVEVLDTFLGTALSEPISQPLAGH